MMQFLIRLNLEILGNTCLFVLAITSSLFLIAFKNPIYKILMFLLTLIFIAIIWIILNAEFLAMLTILLHIASSIVLFLFTIMMLEHKNNHIQNQFKKTNFSVISKGLISFLFLVIFVYIAKDYIFTVKSNELKINFLEFSLTFISEYIVFFCLTGLMLLLPLLAIICINITNQNKKIKTVIKQSSTIQLLDL